VGGILGMGLTYVTSLLTPYLYESEAVLAINTGKDDAFVGLKRRMFGGRKNQTSSRLDKAYLLLRSNHVISELVENFSKYVEDVDIPLAFPKDFAITDVRERIRLATEKLGRGKSTAKHIQRRNLVKPSKDLLVRMIRQHMGVAVNFEASTISVTYTAASPGIAKKMTRGIVNNFLNLLEKQTRGQLRKREKYLVRKIESELERLRRIEGEMRTVYEKYPEMASLKTTGSRRRRGATAGLSVFAQDYLRNKLRMSEIDIEINTNQKVLKDIESVLSSGQGVPQSIRKSLRRQIIDEIGRLEFKKMELTLVRRIPPSGVQLSTIENKIAKVRKMLDQLNLNERKSASAGVRGKLAGKGIRELQNQSDAIAGKTSRLLFERELVKSDMKRTLKKMKEGVSVEFRLSDLMRQSNEAGDLIKLLASNLQKVRLDLSSEGKLASILIPPSTPYYAINLSTRRKAFFGFFVGILLTAVAFFLRDMQDPILFTLGDLSALNVKHFGTFKFSVNSTNRMASYVISLSHLKDEKDRKKAARVTVFSSMSIDFNFGIWVEEIAQIIRNHGFDVGILRIGLRPKIANSPVGGEETIKKSWIHPNELAFSYDRVIASLRKKHDWIFVVGPHLYQIPGETLVTASADQVFHVVKLGLTRVTEVQKIKESAMVQFGVHHYCVPFKGGPFAHRRTLKVRKPSKTAA